MSIETRHIRSALISVYHKTGLDMIIRKLDALGVALYSTGGTAQYIRDQGVSVNEVADLTAYPSILGGRVKTLHPKVFGGILARRGAESDEADLAKYEIPTFDLVIIDLYPFNETVEQGKSEAEIIEKIDIGGVSLIRAAAKNFRDVLCISSREMYPELEQLLESQQGETNLEQRKRFAAFAFDLTARYDGAIFRYLGVPEMEMPSPSSGTPLRYGENPHQKARFYGDLSQVLSMIQGKPLSYNNLLDVDSALHLMQEFHEGPPCFAILKHTNPCGIATGKDLSEAWDRALECDPLSAFGGILICNRPLDGETAAKMKKLFFEVLIAPDFQPEALQVFEKAKKRILLRQNAFQLPDYAIRSAANGVLMQDKDSLPVSTEYYTAKTSRQASAAEMQDALFGERAGKHLKSNAIAIVKNEQLIGSGIGQTSRVDALRHAIAKAKERGFEVKGSVLYSDAFFPFKDCAEISWENGIEVLIEPGGSKRDQETIDFCEQHNMCLLFTGHRHFKH